MNTGPVRACTPCQNKLVVPIARSPSTGLFWRSRRSPQLAKGVAGAQFLTPEKEVQDALVQGLKEAKGNTGRIVYNGLHHVGLLVEDLERSLEFYMGVLGLELNPARPDSKLPYRGAWLWIGSEMIHLMQLPNPDTLDMDKRPQHGGRDRHFCIGVQSIEPLVERLEQAGVPFTKSMSGRPALFFRDPDMNVLEIGEMGVWRG
ncbi:hypothetical protein WJX75_006113 [Coccomyxa subellipsoidea]|uniref:VOC domain-containing protein n=1 Tax=Coccomyxa subellipsoidea TaxID=248742 RepID=A0ABR2YRZ8_9CHLO